MADNRIISIVRWGWVWYEKLFSNEEAVIRRDWYLRNSRLHKICLSRGQGWWRLWWRFDNIWELVKSVQTSRFLIGLNRARNKEKNKLRHHHITYMVCSIIDDSFRPISAREIAQLHLQVILGLLKSFPPASFILRGDPRADADGVFCVVVYTWISIPFPSSPRSRRS